MPHFGKQNIQPGDRVTLIGVSEIERQYHENEEGDYVFSTLDLPKQLAAMIKENYPYEVTMVDSEGDFKLAGLQGTWPKEVVDSVYDRRVLLSSKLPHNVIGTPEDDSDIFALAPRGRPNEEVVRADPCSQEKTHA